MSTYSSNFNKPYKPDGWQNLPNETTPITAEVLNEYNRIIEQIDNFLNMMEAFAQENKIEKIVVNGTEATITDKTVSITTGGEGGTSDYTQLSNKPSINNVTLNGNKSLADLGITTTDNNYTNADKSKLAGIEANANNYSLPKATTSVLGGVKPDGSTTKVDADGTIHAIGGGGTDIPDITYEAYKALPEEEQANYVGTVKEYPIQGGGSSGGVDYILDQEQDTGIKWVDGRNIYQITIANDFALTTEWTSIPNFDCTGKIPLSVETYLNGIDEYVTASAVKVSGNEVQAVFIVGSTSHSNNITTIKYLKEA